MGGTYRNNNGTIENLSGGNIVDQTLDITSEHAVSNMAVSGKFDDIDDSIEAINTNLDKFDVKSSMVTPTSSGKSTLLEYIVDVVQPMKLSTYSFPANGFSDLPTSDWGYTVTVNCESSAFNVIAYKHQSGCLYYVRDINANRQWINTWDKLALESEVDRLLTWTGISSSNYTVTLQNCTGTISTYPNFYKSNSGRHIMIQGRVRIDNYTRTGQNPGIKVTFSSGIVSMQNRFSSLVAGINGNYPREMAQISCPSYAADNELYIITTESFENSGGNRLILNVSQTII